MQLLSSVLPQWVLGSQPVTEGFFTHHFRSTACCRTTSVFGGASVFGKWPSPAASQDRLFWWAYNAPLSECLCGAGAPAEHRAAGQRDEATAVTYGSSDASVLRFAGVRCLRPRQRGRLRRADPVCLHIWQRRRLRGACFGPASLWTQAEQPAAACCAAEGACASFALCLYLPLSDRDTLVSAVSGAKRSQQHQALTPEPAHCLARSAAAWMSLPIQELKCIWGGVSMRHRGECMAGAC